MNTYRYSFAADCPGNGEQIIYRLEIGSEKTIYVEDIKAACAARTQGYQEDIAADLHAELGGRLRLIAMHHGVEIETVLAASSTAPEALKD